MNQHVVVNYAIGAASPRMIWEAANGLCKIVWHYQATDDQVQQVAPVLSNFGEVAVSPPGASPGERAKEIARYAPQGITTFSENLVSDTATLASILGLEYQTPEAAKVISSKLDQRQRLRNRGLQNIRFRMVNSLTDLASATRDLAYPLVLKPLHGQGSRYTFRIGSAGDLDDMMRNLRPGVLREEFIIEEELRGTPGNWGTGIGDYVSVEVASLRKRHQATAVVGRLVPAEPFRERGAFYPATLGQEIAEAVSRAACDALTAMGVTSGLTHTEVKLTPRGPEVLEVNGRLGGHVAWLISRCGGPDLVRAALEIALGHVPSLRGRAADGVAFRYQLHAPAKLATVSAVRGFGQARSIPGVETVELRASPGTAVDWREGTGSCLAEMGGWTSTHEGMLRCIDGFTSALQVTLDPA
jgi:biotin carboxylase